MRAVHAGLILAGAACLALLVGQIGVRTLWEDALRLGLGGAAIIVMVAALEHVLHTAGWRQCFSRGRVPSWRTSLAAYFAGYAVSFATPTAMVGGEMARGGLLLRGVPAVEVVTSITLDRLTYAVADSIVGVCGVAVILVAAPLSAATKAGVAVGAALFWTGVGTFFWLQRRGRLAVLLTDHALLRRWMAPWRAARLAEGATAVDRRLAAFHADEPDAVRASVVLHMAATAVSALQIAIFLQWLGVVFQAQQVLQAFCVASAIDLFAFFVPLRLGVHEGARMLAMSLAGLDPALGLLFALVIRAEHIVWATVGFVVYLVVVMRHTPLRRPAEQPLARREAGGEDG